MCSKWATAINLEIGGCGHVVHTSLVERRLTIGSQTLVTMKLGKSRLSIFLILMKEIFHHVTYVPSNSQWQGNIHILDRASDILSTMLVDFSCSNPQCMLWVLNLKLLG